MPDAEPLVTIVAATHNRGVMLEEHLAAVLGQQGVAFEAVYVDDGSTDGTPDILSRNAERHPGLMRWARTENRGPGPARNTAVDMARGKYIVVVDDDTFPASDWLLRLVAAREKHHADVLAYALEPESLAQPAERYLHCRNLMVTGTTIRRDYIGPAFFLMHRELFFETGGFSTERLAAAEDYEFCYRLRRQGASIVFDPSINVPHRFSTDWDGVRRRVRATAIDGARVYHMLGVSGVPLALRAAAKMLAAPLWALRYFPPDLYWVALKMEWLFFRLRIAACVGTDEHGRTRTDTDK